MTKKKRSHSNMTNETDIPIASAVDPVIDDLPSSLESIKQKRASLCKEIKAQRETYSDFCENEDELNETLGPIERDPTPYANGSIKVRPILRKYAQALCERTDLELRIESAEEALRDVDLTPQKVKADVKRYVAICEKKIASQQELCETLKKQVEQMAEVMRCMVTHPVFDNDFVRDKPSMNPQWSGLRKSISLLSHCVLGGHRQAGEFVMDCGVQIDGKMIGSSTRTGTNFYASAEHPTSPLHYACLQNDLQSVETLISRGCDIDSRGAYLDEKLAPGQEISTFHSTRIGLATPLQIASEIGSMDLVKLLLEKGAKIGDYQYRVPTGSVGDLVTGHLQTHGSKPVTRF